MISRLGYFPVKTQNIKSEILKDTKEISIIIPVKNNQIGINNFLTEFIKNSKSHSHPKEIIIIDNNSNPKLKLDFKNYPIPLKLLKCSKVGPASARNLGVKTSESKWILFTDSDCIPTEKLLTGYLEDRRAHV